MIKVNPDQLDLNLNVFRPVHANDQEKMTASLIKYGQLTPVIVADDQKRLVLIDGFKRQRSAKQLGMKSLGVVQINKSRSEAKALIYLLNQSKGFSMITEAALIRDLIEVEGLNQVETALILGRHKSWVCRRLQIIRSLSPEIIEDLKLNMIPVGAGPSLAQLPRDNQADVVVAIHKHGLKSREIRRLVDIWCKIKDPGVRRHLLTSPRQALEIVNQEKEKWLVLIEAVLSRVSDLNRFLNAKKLSNQTAGTLTEFLGRINPEIERLNQMVAKGRSS